MSKNRRRCTFLGCSLRGGADGPACKWRVELGHGRVGGANRFIQRHHSPPTMRPGVDDSTSLRVAARAHGGPAPRPRHVRDVVAASSHAGPSEAKKIREDIPVAPGATGRHVREFATSALSMCGSP
jgi:hypothetical protein